MIFLTLLVLLFILVFIRLLFQAVQEGFVDATQPTAPLDPTFVNSYKKFATFYNRFLANWEKAITTAASTEVEQDPLASPTDTSNATPPTISRAQQNAYITALSKKLNTTLPYIRDPLPATPDNTPLSQLMMVVPKNPEEYQAAFDWMNGQMRTSQQNLNQALQGIPFPIESFQNKCGTVSQCLVNDSDFISKVRDKINASDMQETTKKRKQFQDELLQRINKFNGNTILLQSAKANEDLFQQADTTRKQAESGELFNKISIQDPTDVVLSKMPAGLSIAQLEQQSPKDYSELKSNKQILSLVNLIQQIKRSL
jgi:hypothetical protein